jgi:hypothetical protein
LRRLARFWMDEEEEGEEEEKSASALIKVLLGKV